MPLLLAPVILLLVCAFDISLLGSIIACLNSIGFFQIKKKEIALNQGLETKNHSSSVFTLLCVLLYFLGPQHPNMSNQPIGIISLEICFEIL